MKNLFAFIWTGFKKNIQENVFDKPKESPKMVQNQELKTNGLICLDVKVHEWNYIHNVKCTIETQVRSIFMNML